MPIDPVNVNALISICALEPMPIDPVNVNALISICALERTLAPMVSAGSDDAAKVHRVVEALREIVSTHDYTKLDAVQVWARRVVGKKSRVAGVGHAFSRELPFELRDMLAVWEARPFTRMAVAHLLARQISQSLPTDAGQDELAERRWRSRGAASSPTRPPVPVTPISPSAPSAPPMLREVTCLPHTSSAPAKPRAAPRWTPSPPYA